MIRPLHCVETPWGERTFSRWFTRKAAAERFAKRNGGRVVPPASKAEARTKAGA